MASAFVTWWNSGAPLGSDARLLPLPVSPAGSLGWEGLCPGCFRASEFVCEGTYTIGEGSFSLGPFLGGILAPATWELEEASWVLGGRQERATGWMVAGLGD